MDESEALPGQVNEEGKDEDYDSGDDDKSESEFSDSDEDEGDSDTGLTEKPKSPALFDISVFSRCPNGRRERGVDSKASAYGLVLRGNRGTGPGLRLRPRVIFGSGTQKILQLHARRKQ